MQRSLAARRRRTAAVVLAVATLALAACTDTGRLDAGPSASAAQERDFPAVYAQTIDWRACGEDDGLSARVTESLARHGTTVGGFRCATIAAPLDWNDPGNRETIGLAVVHIPATGDAPIGTLFTNPGGPGAEDLAFVYGLMAGKGFDRIRERYDLLAVDPRGVGRSTPVVCDSTSTIREVQVSACAAANPVARTMGTSQVARDLELLRALMKDDRLHYLGYSYGTALGATYSTLFPERVGRMVLDSAIGSEWATPIGAFRQEKAFAEQVVSLVEGCGVVYRVDPCPFASEDALVAEMARLTATPLIASDGTTVDGAAMYESLASALYGGTPGREAALDTAARALRGDQAAIDEVAKAKSGDLGAAGQLVMCHSFPRDPDIPGLVREIEASGIPRVLGGPAVDDTTLRRFVDLFCDALPFSGDDLAGPFSGSPDAPILVIGVMGDPATPYAAAQRLVDELGDARLLTLDGSVHGVSFFGRSTCVTDAATAYLLDGVLPAEGTVCASD